MKELDVVYRLNCSNLYASKTNSVSSTRNRSKFRRIARRVAVDPSWKSPLRSPLDMDPVTRSKNGSTDFYVLMRPRMLTRSDGASLIRPNANFTLSTGTHCFRIGLSAKISSTNWWPFSCRVTTRTRPMICRCCQMRQLTKSLFSSDPFKRPQNFSNSPTFSVPFRSVLRVKLIRRRSVSNWSAVWDPQAIWSPGQSRSNFRTTNLASWTEFGLSGLRRIQEPKAVVMEPEPLNYWPSTTKANLWTPMKFSQTKSTSLRDKISLRSTNQQNWVQITWQRKSWNRGNIWSRYCKS